MSERLADGSSGLPKLRLGAILAIALGIGFVVWLFVRGNDNSSNTSKPPTASQTSGPAAATPAKLRSVAAEVGHPVYWAGPEAKRVYELTETAGRRVYIRYLPHGVHIGTRRAAFTIVGTYPVANAFGVLRTLARKSGEKRLAAPNGAIAVYSTSTPTNVYVARRGSNLQIEVFDPSPRRARQLVTSGRIVPVR